MPLRSRTCASTVWSDALARVRRRASVPSGFGQGGHGGAGQEIAQQRPDLVQVGHEIHGGRRQRGGHAGVGGGLRVLDDDRAAGCLHLAGARRAVRAGAGQDHGDQALAIRRWPRC